MLGIKLGVHLHCRWFFHWECKPNFPAGTLPLGTIKAHNTAWGIRTCIKKKYTYSSFKWFKYFSAFRSRAIWSHPTRRAIMLKKVHIQLKNSIKHFNYLPPAHTSFAQSTLCMVFAMYLTTIQQLQQTQSELKKIPFAVDLFNMPVTLKQGQGHRTWYELVDQFKNKNKI